MRPDHCNVRAIGSRAPIFGPKRMEAQDFVSNNQRRGKADRNLFSRRLGVFRGTMLLIWACGITASSLFRRFLWAISTRPRRF